MKYTVIFYSETGNTEKISQEIFDALKTDEKELINLGNQTYIPQSDVYIIGFPVQRQTCSIKIIECLEDITSGKIALFATCGLYPNEKYREKIEDTVSVWLPDNTEYLGMFMCQGRTSDSQKDYFYELYNRYPNKISEMLSDGDSHPDKNDMSSAAMFARKIEEAVLEY